MKRVLTFLLCTALCLSLLAGCGTKAAPLVQVQPFANIYYDYSNWDFLTAENEIVTYDQLDTNKTPLVVGLAGNTTAYPLVEAFAQQHPECQLMIMDITCGETDEALIDALENGRIPDVLFTATSHFVQDNISQYFIDMSDNPVCLKYYTSALQQFDVDGKLYHLPGPSGSFGVIYNKTLFAEHGWNPPKTFDEFLALCRQIETETDGAIDAFNPNAKYAIWLSDLLLTSSYSQLLQKPQDYRWLQDFLAGNATFAGHMEPLFENAIALAEAGALTDADWNQSATVLRTDFLAGKIAMTLNTWSADFNENPLYEYDMFPIPGKTADDAFVISLPTYAMTVSKPAAPRSPEKQAVIDALVDFVSSGEGQSLLMNVNGLVPSVVDIPLEHGDNAFPLLRDTLESGRVCSRESFSFGTENNHTLNIISAQALAIIQGTQTPAGACAAVDAYAAAYFSGKLNTILPEIAGHAEKNFTMLQTTQLFCDIFREKTQADIAIVMHNASYRGNLMSIYTGELNAQDITNLKPRSLAGDSPLLKLEMTGAELLDCLNHPYNSSDSTDYNVVYAFSGLRGTVRPTAPLGEKYVAVTLADGSALEPDKVYTVATWSGMVWERYAKNVVTAYPESFQEIFTQYLQTHSPISPSDDGRMTLLWDESDSAAP